MMTKKQKIWMWIFLAMFIVPEILWSPVGNFYYELLQSSESGGTHPFRNNFLQNSDNLNNLKFVIFIQFIGLLLFLIYLIKNKKEFNTILRYISMIFLSILLIFVSFSLYFALTFNIGIL